MSQKTKFYISKKELWPIVLYQHKRVETCQFERKEKLKLARFLTNLKKNKLIFGWYDKQLKECRKYFLFFYLILKPAAETPVSVAGIRQRKKYRVSVCS